MDISTEKLKKIAKSSQTAEIVATSLAMRERLTRNSNIGRYATQLMNDGEKINPKEYSKFWKDLEDAGIGRIVYGRNGKSDVFSWFYNLKDVAQAAVDGTTKEIASIESKPVGQRKRGYKKVKRANNPSVILRKAPQNLIPTIEENPQVLETTTDKDRMEQAKVDRKIYVSLLDGSMFETTIKSSFTLKDIHAIINAIQLAITG